MVTPFDNVLRYHVKSRSRREVEHVVDLELYGGNGACSCENFTYRLEPHLKKGAAPSDALRCRHIRLARQKLTDDIVLQATKAMSGKQNTPRKETGAGALPAERHLPAPPSKAKR